MGGGSGIAGESRGPRQARAGHMFQFPVAAVLSDVALPIRLAPLRLRGEARRWCRSDLQLTIVLATSQAAADGRHLHSQWSEACAHAKWPQPECGP